MFSNVVSMFFNVFLREKSEKPTTAQELCEPLCEGLLELCERDLSPKAHWQAFRGVGFGSSEKILKSSQPCIGLGTFKEPPKAWEAPCVHKGQALKEQACEHKGSAQSRAAD